MTKVVFNFDENGLKSLQKVKDAGKFTTLGSALGTSIEVYKLIQEQCDIGFNEVIMRNPITNQERTVNIPSLDAEVYNSQLSTMIVHNLIFIGVVVVAMLIFLLR